MRNNNANIIPAERIQSSILLIRNQKVMLDSDLAALYGVETKVLKQAVNRNRDRFPEDFMFQLTWDETEGSRSQFVTLNGEQSSEQGSARRGSNVKYRPYAFTEQGVAMLSSVLRSPSAVAVNVEIMRAFVRLRQMLASNAALARKLEALEGKYDAQFKVVFDAIRNLMKPAESKPRRIVGFH